MGANLQFDKLWAVAGGQPLVASQPRLPTSCRPPALRSCPIPPPFCKFFLLPHIHLFLHMWLNSVGWLQHMPALLRLLLEFSSTHNF
jgi:hypothetical protein